MPGNARPSTGPSWSGAGLRALADAVNEILAGLGAQPAFAVAGSPAAALHAGSSRGRRPSPSPAGQPGTPPPLRPVENGPDTDPTAADTAEPAEIDGDHVEVWQLVVRAQAGDGEAFGQLYDRYVDTVFRFIFFRVNDRSLAEDFTSETFLRALRRIGTISYQGRDIGAWFVTIARNIVLDHMKSARHRLEVTTADTIEGTDREPGPENAVIDAITAERLLAAVNQLGDEQRECVLLRFIQGFSVSETAAVMGKNDGAIKALQHRAVRKLAELVGSELR
jgi:RNA polymerase sigma-70 factor (ECF subfamily)